MKAVAAFVLGAVIASGVAIYMVKSRRPVEPAVQALVVSPLPAAAAPRPVETTPVKPAVQPAVKKASTPVRVAYKSPAPAPPAAPPVQAAPAPIETRSADPAPAVIIPPPAAPVETPRLAPPPPAPRQPHTVTLAAGTLLSVRMGETVSSEQNEVGDTFTATLDQPIVIDGFVIAERRARLEGRVVAVERAGRVKGLAKLSVELVKLMTADGQRIAIQTQSFAREGATSKGEDAAKIGAAAAIGAAIGAIAGGGKGAAIGAGAGGAAGTGGVLGTRGKAAELPVETLVSFRLREPVSITEKLR